MSEHTKDPFAREDLEDSLNDLVQDEGQQLENQQDEEIVKEEQVIPVVEEQKPKEIVEKAKSHGHLSPDEYKAKYGSMDGYKTEEQFEKYGEAWNEVKDVIKNMQKQLTDREKQIDALVKYQERTEERAFQKIKVNIDTQLNEAEQLGDINKIKQLIQEKQKLEFQEAQRQQQRFEEERLAAFNNFQERNKHWYGINPIVTERAKQLEQILRTNAVTYNIPLTYEQLSQQMEHQLKVEFPDIVGIIGHSAPAFSATRSATNKSSTTITDSDDKVFSTLDDELKSIYTATRRLLEKQGKTYSKKEFINRLKKDGEI